MYISRYFYSCTFTNYFLCVILILRGNEMNEREIERARKIVDLYKDINETNQALITTGAFSFVATVVSAIINPVLLFVGLSFMALSGCIAYKIKSDQSDTLKELGLTSKDLTTLRKSGEIDRLYDLAYNNKMSKEANAHTSESFDYLPGQSSKNTTISRTTIYLNRPKKNADNDKSNEI